MLLPRWSIVLLIYLGSRAVSTALLAAMFAIATANHWEFASHRSNPDFFTFSGSWDASFYKRIAEHGYPAQLPTAGDGAVLPNEWAFLPLFPWLVRAVMAVTALPFYSAGVLVATACGAGAAVVLSRLLAARTTERAARWGTVLFCFGPLSFILQAAYAESLFLLLVFASLLALVRRRYLLLIPLAVAASFTRPGALAIALALGIHLVVRWRGTQPFPWRQRLTIIAGGAVIAVAGLAWPVIASAATGNENAYLETELSWWVGFVGKQQFVPLAPWFEFAGRYLGVAGIVLVLLVLAAFAWWLSSRAVRRLRHEIIAFAASYGLYLVAVFLPQQSLFRMLLPLAPLLADGRLSRTRTRRWTLLAVSIALQAPAMVFLWFLGYP
jgi:hypothetical protein